jgi:hypothetical protein
MQRDGEHMTCGKRKSIRPVVARLFAAGKERQAVFHRREACNHASRCGRWCRWLLKGPGIDNVACGHPEAPGDSMPADLTAMLDDPAAECPDGIW